PQPIPHSHALRLFRPHPLIRRHLTHTTRYTSHYYFLGCRLCGRLEIQWHPPCRHIISCIRTILVGRLPCGETYKSHFLFFCHWCYREYCRISVADSDLWIIRNCHRNDDRIFCDVGYEGKIG